MPGAVFVVAGPPSRQLGPVAAFLSTAGWAAAARRRLGNAWIATPAGIEEPGELRRRGSSPPARDGQRRALRRAVPAVAKTAVKDLRQWRRASRFSVDPEGPWRSESIDFVWQRHELFQDAGLRLADELGVPSVLFVPATLVWEGERWGVPRPLAGRVEARGEGAILRRADLVACGSHEIAEQVDRLGVPAERRIITPSGVDLDVFADPAGREATRQRLGVSNRFVVGWVGSFRRFHAVERAVAAAHAADATLLLVGDGPERPAVEETAVRLGVDVVATGTVLHHELPAVLAAMDVGLLLAPIDGSFHYSPLKVAEYLAAGLPVVAPAIGQLTERLVDGTDALLVPPNDDAALAEAVISLRDDPEFRRRLGESALEAAHARWSWDVQVQRLVEALGIESATAT